MFPSHDHGQEGNGLDMEEYSDLTYDGTGSNWINAAAGTVWKNINNRTLQGGSYLSASWNGAPANDYNEFNYKVTIGDKGSDDVSVKITGLVEKWLAGDYSNYGVGVFLTGSQESGSQSYYTKKFSARDSEYFFSRPIIEARWDSSKKDNRANFVVSSSNLSAANNLNTVYLYNYFRGQPTNLANLGANNRIFVNLFTSGSGGEALVPSPDNPVTGGFVETGVYSASFALDTTASVVYDRWWSDSSGS